MATTPITTRFKLYQILGVRMNLHLNYHPQQAPSKVIMNDILSDMEFAVCDESALISLSRSRLKREIQKMLAWMEYVFILYIYIYILY